MPQLSRHAESHFTEYSEFLLQNKLEGLFVAPVLDTTSCQCLKGFPGRNTLAYFSCIILTVSHFHPSIVNNISYFCWFLVILFHLIVNLKRHQI